jgi:hypothetical protein
MKSVSFLQGLLSSGPVFVNLTASVSSSVRVPLTLTGESSSDKSNSFSLKFEQADALLGLLRVLKKA